MAQSTKRLIKSSMRRLGFHVGRLSPATSPALQLLKGLEHFGIEFIFDIGANRGQFASELLSFGYRGRIASFEPLVDAHRDLAMAAADSAQWDVAGRTAIGDFDGEIEFNIAGNSVSSSALPMLDSHAFASTDSAYVGKVQVPIVKLDSIAAEYRQNVDKFLIKIDTQGFEWQVLDGAPETLAQATGVLCELSLVPLYEGQQLWLSLIQRLASEGFTLWSLQNGFTDRRNGRTLQVNATFFRAGEERPGQQVPRAQAYNLS